MKFKTINNIKVRPIKTPDDIDKRPPKGADMIPTAYANIALIGKKKTGKSSCIATMLKAFCSKTTKVHIFCSTVLIDPTYIALGKWMDSKGIEYYPSTSIKSEDGFDLINDILREDEDMFNDHEEEEEKPKIRVLNLDPQPKKRKPRKSKYKDIHRLIIFDDISSELKTPSLIKLMKMHRHIRSKVIVSSQWIHDVPPQSIAQLDYTFLFKNIINEKLEDIHKKLDLSTSLGIFIHMYHNVTGDKKAFNFLYIDRYDQYRQNFNKLILLEEE